MSVISCVEFKRHRHTLWHWLIRDPNSVCKMNTVDKEIILLHISYSSLDRFPLRNIALARWCFFGHCAPPTIRLHSFCILLGTKWTKRHKKSHLQCDDILSSLTECVLSARLSRICPSGGAMVATLGISSVIYVVWVFVWPWLKERKCLLYSIVETFSSTYDWYYLSAAAWLCQLRLMDEVISCWFSFVYLRFACKIVRFGLGIHFATLPHSCECWVKGLKRRFHNDRERRAICWKIWQIVADKDFWRVFEEKLWSLSTKLRG